MMGGGGGGTRTESSHQLCWSIRGIVNVQVVTTVTLNNPVPNLTLGVSGALPDQSSGKVRLGGSAPGALSLVRPQCGAAWLPGVSLAIPWTLCTSLMTQMPC